MSSTALVACLFFLVCCQQTSGFPQSPLGPQNSFYTTEDIHREFDDPLLGDATTASYAQDDPTVIQADKLPERINYMPEVGNGHLATPILGDAIFMNGLYNGANITSHRARIPTTVAYMVYGLPPGFKSTYVLNMGKGYFVESHKGDGVTITLTTLVHRVHTATIATLLTMRREDVSKKVEAFVHLSKGDPTYDIHFYKEENGLIRGQTKEAEYPELASNITFYMKTSASLKGRHAMTPGKTTETIAAFTTIDVHKQNVLEDYEEAVAAFHNSTLMASHVKEWERIWSSGKIHVEGNITLSRINYAAMYYLYSSLPFNGNREDWPFIGLSPGGLAHGASGRSYNGHVFWDQDIWMAPGLSLLHEEIGQLLVETRTKTLKAAELLAHRTGFEGARYPWESAYTGLEVCPASPYSDLEIHITGDVVIMLRQYWYQTRDWDMFLHHGAYRIVKGAATFFASRVFYDTKMDAYRIFDVMPPDEYHYPVNDSVYTNAIAKCTLNFANELARALGEPENDTWTEIAGKLQILYDPVVDYNPEFHGYRLGEYTKQADVVLLPYPLMAELNASTRTNNLHIYEKSTPIGPAPAMTWGMFLLNWLLLGNETKADELFHMSIVNAQPPFFVWSENSDGGGATNFLTGMGGHLQSLLFGYGGCRIRESDISFNPIMIPSTTSVTFQGMDYMGCALDLVYTKNDLNLTLTSIGQEVKGLLVYFYDVNQTWFELPLNRTVSVERQPFKIKALEIEYSYNGRTRLAQTPTYPALALFIFFCFYVKQA